MSGFFESIAAKLVRNRSRMPKWMRDLMESAARSPDGFVGRLSACLLGGTSAPNTEVPSAATRVYIAPTNYSGQGYLWARSLEAADQTLGARNMAIQLPGGFAFPADTPVSIAAMNASVEWALGEWEAARQFSHVLVEAERSMFGKQFDRDLDAEITALEAAGVSVAFICHGTDIRDPRRHAAANEWSPYPEDPRTETLQADAEHNLALLERLRRPTFVSTPDLLADVPWATWCPVIADVQRFTSGSPVLGEGPARVIHISSDPLQKGSDRLEPALAALITEGHVVYELVAGVAATNMPGVIAAADIVLDQFRIGSYGVAACEAMAAGRIVVGHVLPEVREWVREATGLELPIVEAMPDTLHEVIAVLLDDPVEARRIAEAGPPFVSAVHSGTASAEALLTHWIRR